MSSTSAELSPICKSGLSGTGVNTTSTISEVFATQEFCVKPDLLEVLKLAGAEGELFTIKEVLRYLRVYISSKFLFVPSNPKKIVCENDPLEKAFGVKTFMISDVVGLLSNNMYLVTAVEKGEGSLASKGALSNVTTSCATRKRGCEGDEFISPKIHCPEIPLLAKRAYSPIFIELAKSPQYDSSPETVFSYQDYETSAVKDSSDDLWFLETEDEFEVSIETDGLVEYEVASLSSSNSGEFSDTESEVAEVVGAAILLCQNDSDVEFWADSSDNDEFGSHSDTDPEITDGDKWKCQRCAAFNRPFLRFCQKCWQLRADWLPNRRRPKRQHRRLKKTRSVPNGGARSVLLNPRRRKTSRSLPDVSIAELHESSDSTEKQEPSSSVTSPSLTDSQDGGSHESLPGASHPLITECTSSASISTMCNICLMKPKNASIIHGRTGHQICCYGCGKKLWERNKPCPVCRRTIQKVIQNFIV